MSVGTGTVGSGTKIKYVSWGAGDTAKAIFDGIASVMTGSGGWTLASGASGSFFTTYYDTATTDIRRVYSSPLLAQGSGLTTKYVMLRVATAGNITVGGTSVSGFLKVQLIPFQSWNSGTDVGTNQAGQPLINNSPAQYGFDSDFLTNYGAAHMAYHAPDTIINNSGAGLMYVAYNSNAAYLVMWPYYSVNGQLFNSQRVPVLAYGEVAEDVASYTNVPPVYVTTLQRMCLFSGILPSATNGYLYPSASSSSAAGILGANNTYVGSLHSSTGFASATYLYHMGFHPGPMWLSPVAPGSTTGFTGIADTVRTGVQASAFQRMTLGHLGEYGCTTFYVSDAGTFPFGTTVMRGDAPYDKGTGGGNSTPKYQFMHGQNYTYNAGNTYTSSGSTALNSTNFKGIEPILGGGLLNFNTYQVNASMVSGYGANPFPIMWQWGRMRGLKYVGAPPTSATQWSTLDTVSMNVDADGFYIKTGGTATTFALIGFAPFKVDGTDWGAGDNNPNMFWAIPA